MRRPEILVRIVSYRDPELTKTLAAALAAAAQPGRLRFAVVNQYGPETQQQIETLREMSGVRTFHQPWRNGRGLGWARRMTDRMWQTEKFSLQIDSHSRFSAGWDEALVAQWELLEDSKGVLSCYPGPYRLVDETTTMLREARPHIIVPAGTDRFGLPRQDSGQEVPPLTPTTLVAGGFQFARGQLCDELPQVPEVMVADEYVQALRLFTHGWNVYAPGVVPVFHQYRQDRAERVHDFVEDFAAAPETQRRYERLLARSLSVAREIISGTGVGYVGAERSREEFGTRLNSMLINMPSE